jgi:hypothetical protein
MKKHISNNDAARICPTGMQIPVPVLQLQQQESVPGLSVPLARLRAGEGQERPPGEGDRAATSLVRPLQQGQAFIIEVNILRDRSGRLVRGTEPSNLWSGPLEQEHVRAKSGRLLRGNGPPHLWSDPWSKNKGLS